MTKLKLEKDIIIKRLEGIEAEIEELNILGKQSLKQFESGDGWKLAQFHLHRALEGVFNIASHILSRLPGGQATQYKEMAQKLGEFDIVPRKFALNSLTNMAKYRNRLVHFYAEISAKELHQIIKKDLIDFDIFLSSIKSLLQNPEKFSFRLE